MTTSADKPTTVIFPGRGYLLFHEEEPLIVHTNKLRAEKELRSLPGILSPITKFLSNLASLTNISAVDLAHCF